MSNSLYHLAQEFRDIVANIEEMELDETTKQDTLDSLKMPIEEKVENIVKYMRSLEALAEAKRLESKRLNESAASDLKKAEFFKNYITNNLQAVGIKDLQAGVFKIGFRKGSEVVQIDEKEIPLFHEAPNLYVQQEPKLLGKPELKKLLAQGLELRGVSIVRNPDSLVVK